MVAVEPALHSAGPGTTPGAASGWRLNYASLLLAQLVSSATFASINPFLPLYLIDLGEDQAASSSGLGPSPPHRTSCNCSRIRSGGRSQIATVARRWWWSLFGVAIVMGVLVFAQAAWQVFVIRAVQGRSPRPILRFWVWPRAFVRPRGLALAWAYSRRCSSSAPLRVRCWADSRRRFGYRGAFMLAGGMAFVNAIVVILLVHEPPRPRLDGKKVIGIAERVTLGFRVPGWRSAILATLGYQAAYSVGYILLPLQVISATDADNGAAAVGWVIAANAAGIASGAAVLGWLTARVGSRRMAVLALLGAAC